MGCPSYFLPLFLFSLCNPHQSLFYSLCTFPNFYINNKKNAFIPN